MSYKLSFNDRINQNFVDVCSSSSFGVSQQENLIELVDKVLDKSLTQMEKFIFFVRPGLVDTQFKFDDRVISIGVGQLKGEAKALLMRKFKVIEKLFNERLNVKLENHFSELDSVLKFVENNDELLDLIASNYGFKLMYKSKMEGLISQSDSVEIDSLASRASLFMQGRGWNTQTEYLQKLFNKTVQKISGELSAKEACNLMKKRHLKCYERWRILHNIENLINQILESDTIDNRDLMLSNLSHYIKSAWKGFYDGNHFESIIRGSPVYRLKNEGFQNFWIFYQSIFNYMDVERKEGVQEIQTVLLKSILAEASVDEVDKFLDGLHECTKHQEMRVPIDKRREIHEREIQCLRNIPLKSFLKMLSSNRDSLMTMWCNNDTFRITLLLFVESIKNGDLEGVCTARAIIAKREGIESSFEEGSRALYEHDKMMGLNPKRYSYAKSRFPYLILSTLNAEELEIFRNNFDSKFDLSGKVA